MAVEWKKILLSSDIGIADDNVLEVDGSPNDGEVAVFTAAGINGLSEAEFKTAYNLEAGTDFLAEQTIGIADDNLLEVDDADAADNDYAKFTANGLEGRSYAEVLSDLSAQMSAAFDLNGQDLTNGGVIFLTEQAAAEADVGDKGQVWVKSGAPNTLWFTDDAGTDFRLGAGSLATVSADDTTPGYLNGKLTGGTGITLTENSGGGDETLDIKISDGGVDTTQLAADAVEAGNIADDAVGSEHIEQLSADLDFGGYEGTDMCFHNVADDAGRDGLTPVLGKIVFKVDDLHPYICTSVA